MGRDVRTRPDRQPMDLPGTYRCTRCGKLRFATQAMAEYVLRMAAADFRGDLGRAHPVRAYLDPVCGWWHVTKSAESRER